jgi:hypothetical protein
VGCFCIEELGAVFHDSESSQALEMEMVFLELKMMFPGEQTLVKKWVEGLEAISFMT